MPSRSQAFLFIALRVHAERRNVMQAVSPVALGDELNTGWHPNVPSRCLFSSYCSFCRYRSSIRARPRKIPTIARMPFILLEIARHAVAQANGDRPESV
jgi:hypothetical protein